jgi:ketosteroid isomerase-like protein
MEMSEKDILALEDRRFTAMTSGDMGALEALLHDDLIYTHSSANVDTKASWLETMKSGKTKYKSGTFTERKVRMFGDSALVTGKGQIEVEIGGQPRTLKLRYLNVWTKTPQGWKFVAWQSTPLPA